MPDAPSRHDPPSGSGAAEAGGRRGAARDDGRRAPRFAVTFMHLAALWTLACVWPLFDLLRQNAEFFVARGSTAGDVLILAFAFTLVPPLILAALVWLANRIRPAIGWGLQLGLVGVLVGILAFAPLGDVFSGSAVAGVILALLAGAAAAFLYARYDAARSLASVLSLAPVAMLVLLLVVSPVSRLVFSSSTAAAAVRGVKSDTPVVWVTFDELPAISLMNSSGRIDAHRVPNFARLARDSTWYRDATTVADYTAHAVPALLSGSRPVSGELPTVGDHPYNLFTLLGGHYRLNVTEAVTDLCPEHLCSDASGESQGDRLRSLASDLSVVEGRLLLPKDLRNHLPATDQNWQGFGDSGPATKPAHTATAASSHGTTAPSSTTRSGAHGPTGSIATATQSFVDQIRRGGSRPQLDSIHLVFPHVPWSYLSDGQRYKPPDAGTDVVGLTGDLWTKDRTVVDDGWQRHLLQTRVADWALGRILDRLHKTGIYDRALIVVVADHGVSFHPGDHRRSVTKGNFPEIANPPLFVKLPDQQRGRVSDAPVRTIDILPTVAKLLGVRVPADWHFDGAPFDADVPARDRVTISANAGGNVSMPFDTFVRERDDELARQSRLLAPNDSPYQLGSPQPELIGRAVSKQRVTAPAGARAALEDPGALANVDPRAAVVPAYISARVSGIVSGRPVAVALDGRIAATTRVSDLYGQTKVSAIVPPRTLRRGANEVGFYEILPGGALRPFSRQSLRKAAAADYRLKSSGGQLELTGPGGQIAISPDTAVGYVGVGKRPGMLSVSGWAARKDLLGVVEEVVIFSGDRQVAVVKPSLERDDVVKAFHGDESLRLSGFGMDLRANPVNCRRLSAPVRAFGVVGNRATELKPLGDIDAQLARSCPS